MKKGFTLIELISVIILLGVVSLIAYPIINNSLKGSKQKAYDNQVASIIDLSKRWGVDHVDLLPVGTAEKIITFDDLIKGGYITKTDKGIINPLTDKPMTGCVIVSYSNEYNQYLYRYDEACKINKYVEADLNGNDPVLDNGLIPVMYKDNKWVVASPSDTWYNYTSKQWANAIIVNTNKKAEYIAGKPVVEEDVLAYMVWVPRYEYKVRAKEQAIDIKFTTSPTTTSGYIMHPAFTFDNKQQKGLWVGKFETTGTATDPTIKPGITSLRTQNVSTQFTTAQKFNTYGLTNADSHMMKNTEWGAVAYLTQSIYGRCTSATSCTEVGINNNSSFLTGYGAPAGSASSVANGAYTTPLGQGASTTGNITGIYDMSGGAYEYVMGNYATNGKNGSGHSAGYNSGFNGWLGSDAVEKTDGVAFPDPKYFDSYTTPTGINGDATNADNTNGFYGDLAFFTNANLPWFIRGGYYVNSTSAGIFAFDSNGGSGSSVGGFRVCFCR